MVIITSKDIQPILIGLGNKFKKTYAYRCLSHKGLHCPKLITHMCISIISSQKVHVNFSH